MKTRVFELLFREFSRKKLSVCITGTCSVLSQSAQGEMEQTHVMLTPFNYFKLKAKMIIQMGSKGLYIVTMVIEADPNSHVEKTKYFNRLDKGIQDALPQYFEIYSLPCGQS